MPTAEALDDALLAATGSSEPGGSTDATLRAHLLARESARSRIARPAGGIRFRRALAWGAGWVLADGYDMQRARRVLALVGAVEPGGGQGCIPFERREDGLHVAAIDVLLADVVDDADDGLRAAVATCLVHARGAHAGAPAGLLGSETLAFQAGAWRLAWLPPDDPELAPLAEVFLARLDPDDRFALGALRAGPLGAAPVDAVARALATTLAGERHALHRRARGAARAAGALRLLRSLHRLVRATPPPMARGRCGDLDVASDGRRVSVGGDAEAWPAGALDPTRLDAKLARAVLRAAGRDGASAETKPLLRWLSGMSRLRVDATLLRLRGGG